jgi:hypothetical protein
MDSFMLEQVRRVRISVKASYQDSSPSQYINEQMHKDHHVSRRARRKDTLSAEDPGILLQWPRKYGKTIFPNERQRVQLSLLMLFSAFTGTRPGVLLATFSSGKSAPQETPGLESNGMDSSQGSLAENSSDPALKDDSDADTLVDEDCKFITEATRPNNICYGDISLFLLRNPDNSERDILMAEVDFRNLKGRPEGADR